MTRDDYGEPKMDDEERPDDESSLEEDGDE